MNAVPDDDALALAVLYCDVVVTERACHRVLSIAGLGDRMHTALLRSVTDLPLTLEDWSPYRPQYANLATSV